MSTLTTRETMERKRQYHVIESSLLPLLSNRGPDAQCLHTASCLETDDSTIALHFHGSVLHLRGDLTQQPLVDDDKGHVFLWNGEVFGGDVEVPDNQNDTSVLFERLMSLDFKNVYDNCYSYKKKMVDLFTGIQGPWAFVFYDAVNKFLWYGRDYFGRRSLLSNYHDDTFSVASIGHRKFGDGFAEVPAKMLHCLDVKNVFTRTIDECLEKFPIAPHTTITNTLYVEHRCLQPIDKEPDIADFDFTPDKNERTYCSCGSLTKDKNISFDGSVKEKPLLKVNECIDCHGDSDKLCCQCLISLKRQCPETNEKTICQSIDCSNTTAMERCKDCNLPIMHQSLVSRVDAMQQFLSVLETAVRKRVFNIPRTHLMDKSCCKTVEDEDGQSSKVGILFSGGIDSVVLTALADRCTPPHESIDLINVAFAQKSKVLQNVKKKNQKPLDDGGTLNFNVPDRVTGREALKDLSKDRRWNFIEVDVTLEELQKKRESDITNLVHPLNSVLDDSIGCAIWFAAKGTGTKYRVQPDGTLQLTHDDYKSPVKVLLCGMGADEQLGGYARHRTKFECLGWVGLHTEMEMEVERISSRNLGRDDRVYTDKVSIKKLGCRIWDALDGKKAAKYLCVPCLYCRCISDHGREARFPFLDEGVVSFLRKLPVCVKCDPRLPRGVGEKIILRELATRLGLPYVSHLPKRAIQFGSRIAKLESSKEKASDTCKRLERIQVT